MWRQPQGAEGQFARRQERRAKLEDAEQLGDTKVQEAKREVQEADAKGEKAEAKPAVQAGGFCVDRGSWGACPLLRTSLPMTSTYQHVSGPPSTSDRVSGWSSTAAFKPA